MQTAFAHAHASHTARPTGSRALGIAAAGLVQAALVYGLVTGLHIGSFPIHTGPLKLVDVADPTKPIDPPPQPVFDKHTVVVLPPTDLVIETPRAKEPSGLTGEAGLTTGGQSIASTHTIPPYPDLSRRLGEEGVVELSIMVTPTGQVADAFVVKSSGFPRLDEAAKSWVKSHWRYRPALSGGQPVGFSAQARMEFKLRNAQ